MNIDFAQVVTAATLVAERLAGARAVAQAQVLATITAMAEAITGPVPLAEKLCWSAKEIAARAYAQDTATATESALIAGEAALTGEDPGDLAGRILNKADAWRGAIATLTGLRRATEATLDAAKDAAAVEKAAAEIHDKLDTIARALTR